MEITDKRIIDNIVIKIDRIIEICNNHSFDEIMNDYVLSDALQYEYEKMYFDVTKLSPLFYTSNTSVPIEQLRGIRNRVAHDYETVSLQILYDTAKNDLPKFKETLVNALKEGKWYENISNRR